MRRKFAGGGGRRWSFGPGMSPAVAWILAAVIAVFVLLAFMGDANRARIEYWGVLNGEALRRGHVWTVATTWLFNAPLSLIFHGLMLVMFVPILEHLWGTKKFLRFFAMTTLVGNAVGGLVGWLIAPGVPIIGIAPFILSSIVAYGVIYANQPVRFFGVVPIKAKALAIGIVALTALFVLIEGAWVMGAAEFSAILLAYLTTSGIWAPNVWWLKLRRWRIRRRYQVIDGGATRPGKKQQWLN